MAPDVAHRAQAVADVLADGGEVQARLVDIGRQHRDAQAAAVGEVDGRLVLVVAHRGEQPRHVFGRIVGLEVGRPVGHQAVAGGVGLVERVVGERQHRVPQRLDRSGREPVVLHAFGEALVLLVEHLTLLLAHRLSQNVCSGERVAGDLLRDAHDLLLVDDQAVGLGKDLRERLGQFRVDRLDRLPVVLAVGVVVVGVHAHRARPVQRDDRDDVLEAGRLAGDVADRASARRRAGTPRACRRGPAARRWPCRRAAPTRGRVRCPCWP